MDITVAAHPSLAIASHPRWFPAEGWERLGRLGGLRRGYRDKGIVIKRAPSCTVVFVRKVLLSALVLPMLAAALYVGFAPTSDSPTPAGPAAADLPATFAQVWSDCDDEQDQSTPRSPKIPCFLKKIPDLGSYEYAEIATAVRQLARQDSDFSRACHQANHTFAERLYDLEHIYEMVSSDDGLCFWSFTHGTITQFALTATEEEFFEHIDDICANLPSQGHVEACAHGLGHGIVIRANDSVFEAEEYCARAAEYARRGCVQAVIMSYADGEASQNEGVNVKLDPIDPDVVDTLCTKFSSAALGECWRVFWLLYPKQMPVAEASARTIAACTLAAPEFHPPCYRGIGESVIWRSREIAPDPTAPTNASPTAVFEEGLEVCEQVDEKNRSLCVAGVGHAFPNVWVEDTGSLDEFPDVCALVDVAYREGCETGVSEFVRNFNMGSTRHDTSQTEGD